MNTLLESHSELFGEDKGDRDNDDEKTNADSLKSIVHGMFTDYFVAMRSHLVGQSAAKIAGTSDVAVSSFLSLLVKFKRAARIKPAFAWARHTYALDDRASEIIEHALRIQIVNGFDTEKVLGAADVVCSPSCGRYFEGAQGGRGG